MYESVRVFWYVYIFVVGLLCDIGLGSNLGGACIFLLSISGMLDMLSCSVGFLGSRRVFGAVRS